MGATMIYTYIGMVAMSAILAYIAIGVVVAIMCFKKMICSSFTMEELMLLPFVVLFWPAFVPLLTLMR